MTVEDVVLMESYQLAYYAQIIQEIADKYEQYKFTRNMMDYDDLLVKVIMLLEKNEKVRMGLDMQYQYLLADEYQDTNLLQEKILRLLTRKIRNITVVGDDNQSIYKFRGAKIENILTFAGRYEECHTVVLDENYRSSKEILAVANEVMTCAGEGIPKQLHGQFSTGRKPDFVMCENIAEESKFIIEKMKDAMKDGIPKNEIAVMIRSARHSLFLESMLVKERIPYNKYGGLRLFDKKLIKDIFAYIQIIHNPFHEISWYRVLRLYPGLGEKSARIIAADMFQNGTGCVANYKKNKNYQTLSEILKMRSELSTKNLHEQIEFLLHKHYKQLMIEVIKNTKYKTDADAKRKEDLNQLHQDLAEAEILINIARSYANPLDFITDFVLDSTQQKESSDAVTITTIHSAKGLEFDTVFMMHCGDRLFPNYEYFEDEIIDIEDGMFVHQYDGTQVEQGDVINDSYLSEELRCFYVAVTRAKKTLYLTCPRYVRKDTINPTHFLFITDCCSVLNLKKRGFEYEQRTITPVMW